MKYSDYLLVKDELEETLRKRKYELGFRWYAENSEALRMRRFLNHGFRFIEEYNGSDIYECNGMFVPYAECPYCFDSIKGCKDKIDEPYIIPASYAINGIAFLKGIGVN